ncbi:uncharacterized protein NPIL_407611 [Nephila pilipes]|uniref:Uncharacterized protein n=1 Tax=Nephila pilipes TaxID=299642 RepID=A0A8X6U063_NEPPI|nr:uncharacterized protein NPIL_407611 [Nephila pilipes]
MAEADENEVCQFILGPVGGIRNPVPTRKPENLDPGKEGFARFIKEARDVMGIQRLTCGYFLDSIRKATPDQVPLSVGESISKEELANSIKRMNAKWKKMYSEEKSRQMPSERKRRFLHDAEQDSPKMAKIAQTSTDAEAGVVEAAGLDESPEKAHLVRSKSFFKVLKDEFETLKSKLTGIAHPQLESTANELKEFTIQNLDKLRGFEYNLTVIKTYISILEEKLEKIKLPSETPEPNEKRYVDYLDEGTKDKKNHHLLLVPEKIKYIIENISVLSRRSLCKWEKISKYLEFLK